MLPDKSKSALRVKEPLNGKVREANSRLKITRKTADSAFMKRKDKSKQETMPIVEKVENI
jgi:glycine cleavage system H lipoate-binding protein